MRDETKSTIDWTNLYVNINSLEILSSEKQKSQLQIWNKQKKNGEFNIVREGWMLWMIRLDLYVLSIMASFILNYFVIYLTPIRENVTVDTRTVFRISFKIFIIAWFQPEWFRIFCTTKIISNETHKFGVEKKKVWRSNSFLLHREKPWRGLSAKLKSIFRFLFYLRLVNKTFAMKFT